MMPMPQSQPQPAPTDDERTLLLLLKAIDSLEAAERTEVLMFLLRRGLGAAPAAEQSFLSVGSSVQLPGQAGTGRPGTGPEHPRPGHPNPERPGPERPNPERPGPGSLSSVASRTGADVGLWLSAVPQAGRQQTVPVRFDAEVHQKLRGWCEANGFPMAAVVRGLVDQFLDGRGLPGQAASAT